MINLCALGAFLFWTRVEACHLLGFAGIMHVAICEFAIHKQISRRLFSSLGASVFSAVGVSRPGFAPDPYFSSVCTGTYTRGSNKSYPFFAGKTRIERWVSKNNCSFLSRAGDADLIFPFTKSRRFCLCAGKNSSPPAPRWYLCSSARRWELVRCETFLCP